MKEIDDTELEDSQLAVRVPKHLKDFFALYSKREGETQQDLVIRWLSKLKQDHARGNPVALITQYLDPNYHNSGSGVLLEAYIIERILKHHKLRKIWGEALSSNHNMLNIHKNSTLL